MPSPMSAKNGCSRASLRPAYNGTADQAAATDCKTGLEAMNIYGRSLVLILSATMSWPALAQSDGGTLLPEVVVEGGGGGGGGRGGPRAGSGGGSAPPAARPAPRAPAVAAPRARPAPRVPVVAAPRRP